MDEIRKYLNEEVRKLIKEEKFEYEAVDEKAEPQPEVKGFADDDSIEKANQFRKLSDKRYIVIGDRVPCDNHISHENEDVEKRLNSIIYG